MKSITRCVLGMLGTDPHVKGLKIIAQVLRDGGFEVIYAGEHNTIDTIVNAAIQEDADVLGMSFSSRSYVDYTLEVVNALRARGADDISVMIGGQIHPDDHEQLYAGGVKGVFGPGSPIKDVLEFVRLAGEQRRAKIA